MKKIRPAILFVFTLISFWGCADQIVSECENGVVHSGIAASYSSLDANLFRPNCGKAGCHSGQDPAAGMNLSGGAAYSQLVDITSAQEQTLKRVKPGDSDNSFIVWKLEARGTSLMPPSGALSAATIDSIKKWIDDGAVQN